MRPIGFYRQLRHGQPDGPDLEAQRAKGEPVDEATRRSVAQYLRECYVIAATSQRAGDALNPSKADVSPINIHTDGTYVWPEDLAYYVETYGVPVPTDLVLRARTGYTPQLDRDEADRVTDWMMQGMVEDP